MKHAAFRDDQIPASPRSHLLIFFFRMRMVTGKLLLALGAALGLVGCAAIGPPRPPSLELPKPPADLRAARKGDKVVLTWSVPTLTTDHQAARNPGPTRICRGNEPVLKECDTPVGEATTSANPAAANKASKQKVSGSYSDRLPDALLSAPDGPGNFTTYAVEALNARGRGAGWSNQVHVPLVRTLPPPPDFHSQLTGQGVVLSWSRAATMEFSKPNPVSYLYRVYRRAESGKANLVGDVPVTGEMNLSLTDSGIEWEKTYYYHVEAVTVIAGDDAAGHKKIEIEGDDSAEVKVFADDVFPPAVPAELQAVFSGPGQQSAIDLVWAPVTDVDLAGYNVYRHEAGGAPEKLNGELVKTPAYRDVSVLPGKTYLYSVSAVDVRGNESARSEEASETAP
jgi:hypothetical protein